LAVLPLAYASNNFGSSWTLISGSAPPLLAPPADMNINSATQPPGLISVTGLTSISCNATANKCTTVGAYVTINSDNIPLSYTTSDGGASWTTNSSLPKPPDALLTQGLIRIALYGISCDQSTGMRCVAVGTYQKHDSSLDYYIPLSYTSTDGGLSWTPNASGLSLPGDADTSGATSQRNQLNSVSCNSSGLFCVAAGYYTVINSGETNSLIYTSSDGGVTWTLNSSARPLPVGTLTGNYLQTVTCDPSGIICSAVGYYTTSQDTLPLSYVSNNAGISWNLSTNPLPLPTDALLSTIGAALYGVS
jgi:hypothetical protein